MAIFLGLVQSAALCMRVYRVRAGCWSARCNHDMDSNACANKLLLSSL
ncbi:MAG: hypothetical protein PHD37_11535 [Gallionellaceae bacterium]|nr:hypothetical protein [Gallionellaceae bacterium]